MFFFNPSIFEATTSAHTTSFPVSARQAPTTSPTYPVPITEIFMNCFVLSGDGHIGALETRTRGATARETGGCVAGIHHYAGEVDDLLVIDRGVVGDDDDRVSALQLVIGKVDAVMLVTILAERRNVRIVI